MNFTLELGSYVLNIIDIVILGIALIAGIAGAFEGFAKNFSSKAALLVGLIAGMMFTELVSDTIFSEFNLSPILTSLFSYMICFIIGYILMLIIGNLLSVGLEGAGLGAVDSLLGFIWAIAFTILIFTLIIMLLEYQNLFDFTPYINKSLLNEKLFSNLIPRITGFLANVG